MKSDLYMSYKVMDSNEGQVVQTIPSLINIDVNENQEPVVSGRELHEGLKVEKAFSTWIQSQLESVDAIENIDFFPLKEESNGGRPSVDYILKLDIAKEICMVTGVAPRTNEETKKLSKQFRKYFIQVEKDWNTPEKVMARALLMAQNQLEIKTEKLQIAEEENIKLGQIIESQKPKLEYLDKILSCDDALLMTSIAFDYGLSAQALNKILCEERVQRNVRGQWILYSDYLGKGYTKTETKEFGGKPRVQTLWTQKGRMLIHEILTKRQVKAIMDLELAEA